jgi:hypothetical protein
MYGKLDASVTSSSSTFAPAQGGPRVSIMLRFSGLDFNKMSLNPDAEARLETGIKQTLLQHLPKGYGEQHISMFFSAGSVKAHVTITAVDDSSSSALKHQVLKSKSALLVKLLDRIKSMPEAAKILEAETTIEYVSVSATEPVEVLDANSAKFGIQEYSIQVSFAGLIRYPYFWMLACGVHQLQAIAVE